MGLRLALAWQAFLCVGMGFGGYIEDNLTFAVYWIAHAIPAVGGYTTCTFLIPMARFSESGVACAALAPVAGSAVQAVWVVEAALYWCYVGNMVSVTYFSFIKPTFKVEFKASICLALLVLVEAVIFGVLMTWRDGVALTMSPAMTPPKGKLFGLF